MHDALWLYLCKFTPLAVLLLHTQILLVLMASKPFVTWVFLSNFSFWYCGASTPAVLGDVTYSYTPPHLSIFSFLFPKCPLQSLLS